MISLFGDGALTGRRPGQAFAVTTRIDPASASMLPVNEAARVSGAPTAILSHVSMSYDGRREVLHDIDFMLDQGEFLSIVGPSGCGKSTILRLIGRIKVLLELLGLSEFGHYYPRALSGGMRQRVALGRLLAYDPEIMLMDEPFGALDAQTKILMGYELLRIWTDYRKSVVFVTHDIEEAIGLSDRILVMTDRPGRIKWEYRVDLPRPRDLRGVRKMPVFHQLSEQIWQDIVANV
jgi:ABC-type nitrate/sulfonate/bicarbonate transport system ATPase subunit